MQAKVTGRAIVEFLKELRGMRSGNITVSESGKARSTNRQNLVAAMGGLSGLLEVATVLRRGGLEFSTLKRQLGELEQLDQAKMNALASEAVQLDHYCLLLIGDKKLILEQIAPLGLPKPVELDVKGQRK